MPELAGQVALVTGAASGIGAAVAERFVAAGACVAAADLDITGVCAVARRHSPAVTALEVDVNGYIEPAEIAECAFFLGSDSSSSLAGEILLANGGRFTR